MATAGAGIALWMAAAAVITDAAVMKPIVVIGLMAADMVDMAKAAAVDMKDTRVAGTKDIPAAGIPVDMPVAVGILLVTPVAVGIPLVTPAAVDMPVAADTRAVVVAGIPDTNNQ
jgi:hypothetical protein